MASGPRTKPSAAALKTQQKTTALILNLSTALSFGSLLEQNSYLAAARPVRDTLSPNPLIFAIGRKSNFAISGQAVSTPVIQSGAGECLVRCDAGFEKDGDQVGLLQSRYSWRVNWHDHAQQCLRKFELLRRKATSSASARAGITHSHCRIARWLFSGTRSRAAANGCIEYMGLARRPQQRGR